MTTSDRPEHSNHRTSLLGVVLLLALGGVAVWGMTNLASPAPGTANAATPALSGVAIHEAVHDRDQSRLDTAIKSGADVNAVLGTDQAGRGGMTPLILACFEGTPESVKSLIDAKAKVEARTADGRTALMYAAGWGDEQKVKILLDASARTDARANDGWTALMWSAARGDAASVRSLVDAGADVNALTKWRQSALMHAARTGSIDKVSTLLSNGAQPSLQDVNSDTALTIAASSEGVEPAVLEALVRAGCAVNHGDRDGVTALMKAAERGDLAQVKALLALGADPAIKDAPNQWTAKDWAAKRDDEKGRAVAAELSK